MRFKLENITAFSEGNQPRVQIDLRASSIRNMASAPLILVTQTGEIVYARTRGEKDSLLARFNEQDDLLLWSYLPFMFRITSTDIALYYRKAAKPRSNRVARMLSGLRA